MEQFLHLEEFLEVSVVVLKKSLSVGVVLSSYHYIIVLYYLRLASESKLLLCLFFLTPSSNAWDSRRFIRLVLFNFLSTNGIILVIPLGAFPVAGIVVNSVVVVASSADMVTARSVKCLTAPSMLVFLFFGVMLGVPVGVVLREALETRLIRSVLPDPDNLKMQK